jgi:hypothetical protein
MMTSGGGADTDNNADDDGDYDGTFRSWFWRREKEATG